MTINIEDVLLGVSIGLLVGVIIGLILVSLGFYDGVCMIK